MKKKFLYIGNKLSKHGNTATSIETLGGFLEDEGFKVYYASSKKNKIFRLLDMLITTIRVSSKVDYVLIDTYSTQNFWFAFFVSQLCRVLNLKYIAKLHGGDLPNRLKKSPFLCDLIFNNAYKVTAPSLYLLDAFKDKYSKNLIYIPNTIELKKYEYFVRDFDVPKILWVRSFSKIYNPKMAIQVAADLKNEFPNVTLCMVGPDKENLINGCKELANKLNVPVTFTGKLSKEEWVILSKDFNVFINTTHFDNTPISVIEAMALGLPVVSTNVGGIPFLISDKENGLLITDNDTEGMTNAILEIFNNEILREKITTNARNTVESFDWNVIKQKWFEILK
ncbi:glycosyltransferase family 4 protein [Flavobacterium koreense]